MRKVNIARYKMLFRGISITGIMYSIYCIVRSISFDYAAFSLSAILTFVAFFLFPAVLLWKTNALKDEIKLIKVEAYPLICLCLIVSLMCLLIAYFVMHVELFSESELSLGAFFMLGGSYNMIIIVFVFLTSPLEERDELQK